MADMNRFASESGPDTDRTYPENVRGEDGADGADEPPREGEDEGEGARDPARARAGLPEEWEDMSAEEREAWAESRRADLEATARDATRLSDSEQAALNALGKGQSEARAEVALNDDVTVEVKTHLSASIEDALDRVAEADGFREVRETMITALAWFIDHPDYGSEEVWRVYAEEYGTPELAKVFFRAASPAMESMEEAEETRNFR